MCRVVVRFFGLSRTRDTITQHPGDGDGGTPHQTDRKLYITPIGDS